MIVIPVKVNEKIYNSVVDDQGVQRFPGNAVLNLLFYHDKLDLNHIDSSYQQGGFSKTEYLEFMIALGYSVSGLASMDHFQDMDWTNPLWEEKK